MARLQILQHKSYHPYLESNKQRVRDDEKRQRELDEAEERRVLQADSEARLALLRARSDPERDASSSTEMGPVPPLSMPIAFEEGEVERPSTGGLSDSSMRKSKGKGREKDDMQLLHRRLADKNHRAETGLGREHPDKYRTKQGHLNFWEPEESSGPPRPLAPPPKPKTQEEIQKDDPTTMYLARTERELKPWYTDPGLKGVDERGEPRDERDQAKREKLRRKDQASKTHRDPLTHIHTLLGPRPSSSSSSRMPPPALSWAPSSSSASTLGNADLVSARLKREQAERTRTEALLVASRRMAASSVSSTPALSLAGSSTPGGFEERRFHPEEMKRLERERLGRFNRLRWEDEVSSRDRDRFRRDRDMDRNRDRRDRGNGGQRGRGKRDSS